MQKNETCITFQTTITFFNALMFLAENMLFMNYLSTYNVSDIVYCLGTKQWPKMTNSIFTELVLNWRKK